MERISAWTHLCTPGGEFRAGTQVGGVAATPLMAGWLNMLQAELVAVIQAAGIELSEVDRGQVLEAIQVLIANSGSAFLPKAGGRMTGRLEAYGGLRAKKGLPENGNGSTTGYSFGSDGDSGLYVVGADDESSSDVVIMLDGVEVIRASKLSGLIIPGALKLAGGQTPYHTGNKPDLLAVVYPVGSIYMNGSIGANPATYFGFGTWVPLAPGRVLLGVGTGTDSRGETKAFAGGTVGGEYNHLLAISEIPAHSHPTPQGTTVPVTGGAYNYASGDDVTTSTMANPPLSGDAGGDSAHNNMQPYLTVYMWQRTA